MNENTWELGGGYYAVFKGNSIEPQIVYRPNKQQRKRK